MTRRLLTLLWTALTLAVPTLPSLAAAPDQIIMLTGHTEALVAIHG